MKVDRRSVRTARIELAGGQEIRLVRWSGDGDGSGHLTISVSWPEAPLGGRAEDSVRIPGGAIPELQEALAALSPEEDPE